MRHLLAAALLALPPMLSMPALAADGTRVQVRGEVIDTWCYYSGVMGGPDAVQGSAHHTCALWCSAGGIPVGLLAEDGTVYMVLKIGADTDNAGGDTALHLAAHTVEADGMLHQRDGINYLLVAEVTSDADIVNRSHEEYGVVPPFAFPEPAQ